MLFPRPVKTDAATQVEINVSYETVRRWCIPFGPVYANRLRKRSGPGGDQWIVDEVFVRIDDLSDGFVLEFWAVSLIAHNTSSYARNIAQKCLPDRGHSNHRELLLNWFRAKGQLSSGVVEGFIGKAKLTSRKAFGFRTYHGAEIALYHALGALPEPEFTHRFC